MTTEFTPLYNAVRRAVEPYEDAVLTPAQADALASDVLAMFEEQAVLDVVNLYGDATLHQALDDIGWVPRG